MLGREYNGKKITQDEKSKLIEQLLSHDKIEFKKLRKAIGKESAEFKFNYKDDDKIVFLFAGHGKKLPFFKKVVDDESLSNVFIYDYLHGDDYKDLV